MAKQPRPHATEKSSEAEIQSAFIVYVRMAQRIGFEATDKWLTGPDVMIDPNKPQALPKLRLLHHVPNGGKRGDSQRSAMIAGNLMKSLGVVPGIPDIHYPAISYCGQYTGLYIEFKTGTGSESQDQREVMAMLESEFHKVTISRSWQDAVTKLKRYMGYGDNYEHCIGSVASG